MPDVALKIKNIKKKFGDTQVLSDINLEVYKGETLALFGGSGSGKSVTLRSIIGLETPDSGDIYFEGKLISGLKEKALYEVRKKIAYVFQNGALFDSLTVFDNLAYPLREHTKLTEREIAQRVSEILRLVDLPDTEKLMPIELSGGMQKRVGLARSIILGPEIILYDEPTAGLDPANIVNILKIMRRLAKQGTTSIFVTHNVSAAFEIADRIAVLRHGQIIAIGSPDALRESTDPWVQKFLRPLKDGDGDTDELTDPSVQRIFKGERAK